MRSLLTLPPPKKSEPKSSLVAEAQSAAMVGE
jgi:hypothetical protein